MYLLIHKNIFRTLCLRRKKKEPMASTRILIYCNTTGAASRSYHVTISKFWKNVRNLKSPQEAGRCPNCKGLIRFWFPDPQWNKIVPQNQRLNRWWMTFPDSARPPAAVTKYNFSRKKLGEGTFFLCLIIQWNIPYNIAEIGNYIFFL